jgi:hypothetical protein
VLKTLKWWFCWPWITKKDRPRKQYDVGISVAEAILSDGTMITITRMGAVTDTYYEWYYTSAEALKEAMQCKWIHADNDTYYNRHYILQYEVKTQPYLVYDDNKPV